MSVLIRVTRQAQVVAAAGAAAAAADVAREDRAERTTQFVYLFPDCKH